MWILQQPSWLLLGLNQWRLGIDTLNEHWWVRFPYSDFSVSSAKEMNINLWAKGFVLIYWKLCCVTVKSCWMTVWYRWLSARLWYLQCVSSGDTTFLHWYDIAYNIWITTFYFKNAYPLMILLNIFFLIHIWGLWCQKQVSQAGISNYIPQ